MIARYTLGAFLLLGLLAAPISGCGGDDDSDGAEAGETSEGVESEGGSEDGHSMASLQKELYEAVLKIETVEDAKAADAEIGAIFSKMADQIRRSADDPTAAMEQQNDPEYAEYQEKMSDHIQKISMSSPMVGIEIGKLMMKHSDKIIDAASELLDSDEVKGALDDASDALEDAEKSLKGLSGD